MLYILFFTLLVLLFIFFIVLKENFLFPSIIFTSTYFVSTFFALINKNRWNLHIDYKTYFVILISILFLFLGEQFSFSYNKYLLNQKNNHIKSRQKTKIILKPSKLLTNFIIAYLIIVLIYFFYHIYTNVGSIHLSQLIRTYRNIDVSMNFVLKLFIKSSVSIAYFYSYLFLVNIIYKNKIITHYLIPIALYLIIETISSNRIGYIYLIIVFFVLFYILLKQKFNWKKKFTIRIFKYSIIAIIIIFLGFYLLGFLTGKSNNNFWNMISLYTGSSIPALNLFLNNFEYDIANFGSETLFGFTNLIKSFGFENDFITNNRILDFVHIGDMPYRTNIYTSLRRLINDYNYFGMLIIQFLTGFIYTTIYSYIRFKKNNNLIFLSLLYSYMIRYLILSFTDERIMVNFLTSTTVIQIFLFWFLIKISEIKIKFKN